MKTNYKPQYTLTEALLKIREIFVEENGRLYTEEEAVKLTDEIRKQIQRDEERRLKEN